MPTRTRKRAISIYRAADSVDLAASGMAAPPVADGTPPPAEVLPLVADAASGSSIKVLVRDAGGFSLVHVWFKANYPLPRHSHSTDCMYYVISGAAVMGRQTLLAGDSFFVPAGAPYQYVAGPDGVEVLEVRYGADQFGSTVVADAKRWKALGDAISANREIWQATPVSPTFAANGPRQAN